jgi:hypothetical protein
MISIGLLGHLSWANAMLLMADAMVAADKTNKRVRIFMRILLCEW